MGKAILILLLFVITTSSKSQEKQSEFQGILKYIHKVIPKDENYDVNNDFSAIGKSSDYFFKEGNIKWFTYNSYFKMNLFIAKENRDYFLTNQSDTIYTLKNNIRDFEIVDYKISSTNEIILGHNCKVLQIKLKPLEAETPISYRRYFFSSDFYIDSEKMENCTLNAYDLIYGQMKSIPLKIEYEFANRTIIWQAIEIKYMELNSHFFELEKNIPIAYW